MCGIIIGDLTVVAVSAMGPQFGSMQFLAGLNFAVAWVAEGLAHESSMTIIRIIFFIYIIENW